MFPTTDTLLSEFVDAWNAGRRPDVRSYLRRVPEGEQRERLAAALTAWIDVAPTPQYDKGTRATIRAEPVVARMLEAVGDDAGLWPQLLPRLRRRSRLSLPQLADRLVLRFELDPADADRTTAYLQRLEAGQLEPTRVSRRLLEALGEVLGASLATLTDAGAFGRGLRPAAGASLFRLQEATGDWVSDDFAALAEAARLPAPADDLDAVDRLFLGGPEG